MVKQTFMLDLKDKLRDLDFRIASLRAAMADSIDDERKVEMRGQLEVLEQRRDELRDKYQAMQAVPESRWSDLRAEWEQEWDAVVHDFEDRVSRLM